MKKPWYHFSIFEFLLAVAVFSIGIFFNFTPREFGSYRVYGQPFSAVEFQIYPQSNFPYGPEFRELAYETPTGYWMPIKSVDAPFCIAFNFLFFFGIFLLIVFAYRRLTLASKTTTKNIAPNSR